jgi:DNA-binding transcriptional MerR regulator
MVDFEEKINRMEIELIALKEKVNFFNVIYGKFDVTLGKIQEMIENRRYETAEEVKDVYERLAESEKNILAEFKVLRQEMKELNANNEKKIADLDKWRWIVVGGSLVVGWILSRLVEHADKLMP